jgi:hypothetical protein
MEQEIGTDRKGLTEKDLFKKYRIDKNKSARINVK